MTQKIKAGALQFVLFIGAVVAVLLMAFMLLSYTHTLFDKQTDVITAAIKGADFGINASLGRPIALGGQISIENENDLPLNIEVSRSYWGIFELRSVTSMHKKTKVIKTALVGGRELGGMPALYVSDKQRPLIIAGNASITGTAYLPEQGIKMGNIHGNSYHRDQLVYGKRQQSKATLPELDNELQQQLNLLAQPNYAPKGDRVAMTRKMVLKNSFQVPTKIIRDRVVYLKDIQLTGNIIVSATDKIIVEASAQLNDVVLLAPKIIVKDWVNGYFQAIASESIAVGKKCVLPYPTALVVHKKTGIQSQNKSDSRQSRTTKPCIYIDSYTEIGGVVMALEATEERQYTAQIKIDDNAKILGEVYCTKNLELKGRVNGSVTTAAFVALENGSIYQNHLYNGMINSTHLTPAYVGLLSEQGQRSKKVMKWLY